MWDNALHSWDSVDPTFWPRKWIALSLLILGMSCEALGSLVLWDYVLHPRHSHLWIIALVMFGFGLSSTFVASRMWSALPKNKSKYPIIETKLR
jgi:hypothetical protein